MRLGLIMEIYPSIFGMSKGTWAFIFLATLAVLTNSRGVAWAQDEGVTLEVSFVGGGNSLDFGRLRNLQSDGAPTQDSSTRQIRLIVRTATGNKRPYIITQVVNGDLVNEDGTSVTPESVLYRVDEETGSGLVRVPDETPLTAGEQEIYQSGIEGGTSQLLITYDLVTSSEQEAGSYAGSIVYRVSTI